MEQIGALYHNPIAKCDSLALAVPKAGTDELTFTFNLRTVIAKTFPYRRAYQVRNPEFKNVQQKMFRSLLLQPFLLATKSVPVCPGDYEYPNTNREILPDNAATKLI